MKFTLALTFLLGASAVKVQHRPIDPILAMIKAHSVSAKHEACPSEAELAEVEEAMANIEEWTPLSAEDAKAGVKKYAKSKGYKISKEEWAQLEEAFNYVDADSNGELSKDEILAVAEEAKALYEEHCAWANRAPPVRYPPDIWAPSDQIRYISFI